MILFDLLSSSDDDDDERNDEINRSDRKMVNLDMMNLNFGVSLSRNVGFLERERVRIWNWK